MDFEKKVFGIGELSVRWECSVEDILRLGEKGDLVLLYDWHCLKEAIDENNLPAEMQFEFKNHHLSKIDRDFLSSSMPEYYECDTDRMLTLTPNDLFKIRTKGQVGISYGYSHEFSLVMEIVPTRGWDKIKYPVINWADVLIFTKSIENFEKLYPEKYRNSKNVVVQTDKADPVINSSKENANLYKTIGLLSHALIDSGSKNLMKGDEPNYSAIVRKLERFIPTDPVGMRETHGLSERSLRERVKKGVDSLVI